MHILMVMSVAASSHVPYACIPLIFILRLVPMHIARTLPDFDMTMLVYTVLLLILASRINALPPNSPLLDSYDYIGQSLLLA